MNEQTNNDVVIEKIGSKRRELLKRVLMAGFTAPVIAAFTIDTLTPSSANAQSGPNAVPEIDGSSAAAALALLTGGALIVRDRLKS